MNTFHTWIFLHTGSEHLLQISTKFGRETQTSQIQRLLDANVFTHQQRIQIAKNPIAPNC